MDNILLLQFAIFFISGFFHGLLGFGFPMIATPLLSLFLTVKESVLLTLFPTMSVNGNMIRKSGAFKEIWAEYKLLILSILFGSLIGTNFLILYYSDSYRILLALVILLYLNAKHINFSLAKSIENNPKKMMILFGLLSGVVSGLVNIMIPVLIIYILESGINKEKSLVIMNLCFFVSKSIQIIIFGSYGSFSIEFLTLVIPIVLVSLFGLFLGSKMRDKIDEKLYTKLLQLTLWGLSFYIILEYLY